MAYRDDVEALQAKVVVLEHEMAERMRARDEAATMLAEARAHRQAQREAGIASGVPARRRLRMALFSAAIVVIGVIVLGVIRLRAPPEAAAVALPGLDRYAERRAHAVAAALAELDGYADQMCQCADRTCAQHIIDRLPMWSMNKLDPRFRDHWSFDAAQEAHARGIAERFTGCVMRAADVVPDGKSASSGPPGDPF